MGSSPPVSKWQLTKFMLSAMWKSFKLKFLHK